MNQSCKCSKATCWGAANLLPASQKCLLARLSSILDPALKVCGGMARERKGGPFLTRQRKHHEKGLQCVVPAAPCTVPSSAWKGRFATEVTASLPGR